MIKTNSVPTFGDILARRMGRRDMLRGSLATAALTSLALPGCASQSKTPAAAAIAPVPAPPAFSFTEIERGADATHHVAPGYRADVLIKWGDPVLAGAPAFDPFKQSAEAQEQQFGYNNDYLGFVQSSETRGVLCVNHEYSAAYMMFPGFGRSSGQDHAGDYTAAMARIEQAAMGLSFVELEKREGRWAVAAPGRFNRRLSGLSGPFDVAGPAMGDKRMQTAADPSGTLVIGTLGNCGGGVTPWGTYLSGEENIDNYFGGKLPAGHRETENHRRMGVPGSDGTFYGGYGYLWSKVDARFDIGKTPNEANRFGWVVEVDPLDPAWRGKKRTALGRFKHEGAESILNKDGRVVVYMGDDEVFQYLYRFVSRKAFDPKNRLANRDLLDDGILSVARFDANGMVTWLPLIFGSEKLTPANGFTSQADVMIDARRAGELLSATPMDRPEDVEPNPRNGKVYVMLTNNRARSADKIDAANPRAENLFGHIVELDPIDGDHAADQIRWDILVQCGDPALAEGTKWNSATSTNGWFASPDNCAVDPSGKLWIATDQGNAWTATASADGIWALETEGSGRGTGKLFFRCPIGAEMCGPRFTDDSKTLFVAVQHPGTDGMKSYSDFGRFATFDDPGTRWPNEATSPLPPQPAVVMITKDDGGVIGS